METYVFKTPTILDKALQTAFVWKQGMKNKVAEA